jgi:hypothetical protein
MIKNSCPALPAPAAWCDARAGCWLHHPPLEPPRLMIGLVDWLAWQPLGSLQQLELKT